MRKLRTKPLSLTSGGWGDLQADASRRMRDVMLRMPVHGIFNEPESAETRLRRELSETMGQQRQLATELIHMRERYDRLDDAQTEMREFITFAAGHSPTTFQAFADYREVLAKMKKAMPKVETEHTMAQAGVAVVHVGGVATTSMTASELASLQAQANAWRK